MGGPAIHVASLASGLETRGYHTTLVAGSLARGEDSMAFVAEQLGVGIVSVPEMARGSRSSTTLTPSSGSPRSSGAGGRTSAHARRRRARSRASPRSSPGTRDLRSCSTFHGHVLKGYFGPSRTAFFRQVERALAGLSDPRRRQPRGARRARRAGGAQGRGFAVIHLGIPLEERLGDATADLDYRALYGIPRNAFVVGWVRADDRSEGHGRGPRDPEGDATAASTRCSASSATVPTAASSSQAARIGIARACYFVGYQEDVAGYYRLFDAFLLPSVTEGTPVSAIEALASGPRWSRTASVASPTSSGTASTATSSRPATSRRRRAARRPRRGSCAPRASRRSGVQIRVGERYSVARLVDDVDRLYRALLDAKGVAV